MDTAIHSFNNWGQVVGPIQCLIASPVIQGYTSTPEQQDRFSHEAFLVNFVVIKTTFCAKKNEMLIVELSDFW